MPITNAERNTPSRPLDPDRLDNRMDMRHYALLHAPDSAIDGFLGRRHRIEHLPVTRAAVERGIEHDADEARRQGYADAREGVPSRFQEYTGLARSAYIRAFSDVTRARHAS